MAENREDILNELIKYYDGEKTSEKTNENKQDLSEEDLGHTRVINKADSVQEKGSQALGDTVVVKVKPDEPEEEQPRKAVYEEVLGNLGIDGRPITHQIETPRETFRKEEEKKRPSETKKVAQKQEEEEEYLNRDGVWYSLKPLWITLILCMVVFLGIGFYATDTGIIGTYKRNFEYNMSVILDLFGIELDDDDVQMPVIGESGDLLVAENSSSGNATGLGQKESEVVSINYDANEKETVIIPFDEADSSGFSLFDNGVVCVKSNYICLIDKNGQIEWEDETSVINPMVKTAGEYIAVAASGGTRLELYREKELCYSIDVPEAIRIFDVSERGDVVLATEKKAYKGGVIVFNKKGEQIFAWGSGVNYITDVAMLKTRQVAVSLVNSDSNVVSYVMMFDVRLPEPSSGVKLENTLIFDVADAGNDVLISGDNTIAMMNEYSEINYDIRFDDVVLLHSAQDEWKNRAVTFTVDNEPVIGIYDSNGDVEFESITALVPDCVNIYGDTVVYSSGRNVVCQRYNNGECISYTAPMEINKLVLMSESRCLLVYEDNLEIIKWY